MAGVGSAQLSSTSISNQHAHTHTHARTHHTNTHEQVETNTQVSVNVGQRWRAATHDHLPQPPASTRPVIPISLGHGDTAAQ
eukprot:1160488-Pelagomonas_calceolata.AAC.1